MKITAPVPWAGLVSLPIHAASPCALDLWKPISVQAAAVQLPPVCTGVSVLPHQCWSCTKQQDGGYAPPLWVWWWNTIKLSTTKQGSDIWEFKTSVFTSPPQLDLKTWRMAWLGQAGLAVPSPSPLFQPHFCSPVADPLNSASSVTSLDHPGSCYPCQLRIKNHFILVLYFSLIPIFVPCNVEWCCRKS